MKYIFIYLLLLIITASCTNEDDVFGEYKLYSASNDHETFTNVVGSIKVEPYLNGKHIYIDSFYPERDSSSILEYTIIGDQVCYGKSDYKIDGNISLNLKKKNITIVFDIPNRNYRIYKGKK